MNIEEIIWCKLSKALINTEKGCGLRMASLRFIKERLIGREQEAQDLVKNT